MSKDISTIKYGNKIKLDSFIVNPKYLSGNAIRIERTKNDPGAVYISISTTGGMIAVFRYAYEGEALKNITKDHVTAGYKLQTASDEIKIAIGNYKHDDDIEKGTEALLNDIFSVLETTAYTMTPHTDDGFMMLVRKPCRTGNMVDAPERNTDYGEDIRIECVHIRDKDEPVLSLVTAINLWGNRIGVEFNTYFYDHASNIKASAAREIYSNPGICEMFITMDKIGMSKYALNRMSCKLAEFLAPADSTIPLWAAYGGHAKINGKKGRVINNANGDVYDY